MNEQTKESKRIAVIVTIEKSRNECRLVSDMRIRIQKVQDLIAFETGYTLSSETEGTVGVDFTVSIPGSREEIDDYLEVLTEQINGLMFATHEYNEYLDMPSDMKPTIARLRN